jgi:hypothetical protein
MKLSAVVQLIDGYSRAPAEGIAPRFLLNGKPCLPHAKPQGFYAFSELADGVYRLTALALPFFPQEVEFDVPLAQPLADAIVPCLLEPSPLYPYPAGTAVIRGQVRAALTGEPLAGVVVQANYRVARGEPRQAATRTSDYGRYDGRYALAPRPRLAPDTELTLTFSKSGYTTVSKQMTLEAATTRFVDIDMR